MRRSFDGARPGVHEANHVGADRTGSPSPNLTIPTNNPERELSDDADNNDFGPHAVFTPDSDADRACGADTEADRSA